MDLSVVVPTLNGRDRLAVSLDSLATHVPDAEVIVVNGPSADGTTGMVRNRDDVDVLVEVSARTLNVARNAGAEVASGDVVAFLRYDLVVEPSWREAVEAGLAEASVTTGPVHRTLRAGVTAETPERRTILGREVSYFDGGNVAFAAAAFEALDGFDEYLETGGARDAAHRLAGMDYEVVWRPEMGVRQEYGADGGTEIKDSDEWRWKHRSLAYRLVKNYGIRPTIGRRILTHAVADAVSGTRELARGDRSPTEWLAAERGMVGGVATGFFDGLLARARDRSPTRNPHGRSARSDRAVARYDWR